MVERQVSAGRKIAFYGGYLSFALGILLFLSAPLSMFSVFSAFSPAAPFSPGGLLGIFLRAVAGMGLMVLGAFLRRIGILGLAGSVTTLDPPKARRDLEPWSRAAGGLVGDALSEVGTARGTAAGAAPEKVMVRCPRCKALNEEGARFCNQCAAQLV
jgi:hypothetical protein